jgi:16S rRNA (cytosine967-C5)-methyltransferase
MAALQHDPARNADQKKERTGVPATSGISPARLQAFAILLKVESGAGHSDDLLRGEGVSALSPADRNLCTALVMGVLRWQIRIDARIRSLLTRPNAKLNREVQIALRLGVFQLLFLDRIPPHAAISESVGLAKQAGHWFASAMVNAVLRKLAAGARVKESADEEEYTEADLAEETAHPVWMVERWVRFYGLEHARLIWQHGQRQPVPAVRLSSRNVGAALALDGIRLESGVLLTAARVVSSGDVTATEAFADGRVRLQEEGSQLVAELAGSAERILDCCAAPGGKTLILAEMNPEAHIVACEVSQPRYRAMRERLQRIAERPEGEQVSSRIDLRNTDVTELNESDFDLVVADVPCSGTGTLGRNPEIRHRLKPEDLTKLHERQCAILWAALLAGSKRVIYSTCSLEPEENEQVIEEVLSENIHWRRASLVERILELKGDGRLTEAGSEFLLNSIGPDGALHLLPGRFPVDGYFVALLERLPG